MSIENMDTKNGGRSWQPALILSALGVVYGDIGTSPLYAIRECFWGSHAQAVTYENVLGVLSLIIWSLVLVVSVKYLGFVMRVSNKGEGGILALLALLMPERSRPNRRTAVILTLGICGAGLLYGDGVITPSLTVLSAIEGLNVATKVFEPYVVPIAAGILIGLFALQRHGTARVGTAFGPVMVLWFFTLVVLGVRGILMAPQVLLAFNPLHAIHFFSHNGWLGFGVLGAVFLVVTGSEALYADMGHFGIAPIRHGWFGLVLPSLLVNYLGQGALLLRHPSLAENPFYSLAPSWGLYPLVALSTLAAIIASQALISGAFSLTMQAVQLGFLPRMSVLHTSPDLRGQIYVPAVNWMLLLGCLLLVAGFGASSRLAAAYGIAVTFTMVITTLLFALAVRHLYGWELWKVSLLTVLFLAVDLAFTGANLLKVAHGGWVPLVMGLAVFTVMTTWRAGRRRLREKLSGSILPIEQFLEDMKHAKRARVPGLAVFMAGNPDGTPLALLHNLKHNRVLHERNVLLNISIRESARVDPAERLKVEHLSPDFLRITAAYGFMEDPDVPRLLASCQEEGFDWQKATFFLSSEAIVPSRNPRLRPWRAWLFGVLSRNAQKATAFFRLPPNRVVELGMQIEL